MNAKWVIKEIDKIRRGFIEVDKIRRGFIEGKEAKETVKVDLVIRDPKGIHGEGIPFQFNFE
jgi:hypothetical protein